MLLREFTMEDYEEVYGLWDRAGLGLRPSDSRDEVARKTERDPDLFLVAVENDQIVGTVMGGFDGRRGWVYHLAVDPAFRHRGIGTELMRELIARMGAKHILKVNLLIEADNLGVVDFYRQLGFVKHDFACMGYTL